MFFNICLLLTLHCINNIFIIKSGIKQRSILFDLHYIKFPDSFPLDIMHLMFENIAKYMF